MVPENQGSVCGRVEVCGRAEWRREGFWARNPTAAWILRTTGHAQQASVLGVEAPDGRRRASDRGHVDNGRRNAVSVNITVLR